MQIARLELRNVRRAFGQREVLSDVTLRLNPGEIVGLLGPNGAGKSTLISIASGSLHPDSGSVTVDGVDVRTHRATAAALIGSAPQHLGIYPSLTLRENVRAFAGLHGLRGATLRRRSDDVIESVGLASSAGVPAEQLSGGQKRRLHLAMALTHSPRLLFLDEPTVGADVESRQQILDLVRRIAGDGTAVLYTTHYLNELEQLPARIALLHHGTLRDLGEVAMLMKTPGDGAVRARVPDAGAPPEGWMRDGDWLVSAATGESAGEMLVGLVVGLGDRASRICDVQFRRPSLESEYVRLLHEDSLRIDADTEADVAAA